MFCIRSDRLSVMIYQHGDLLGDLSDDKVVF